MPFFSLTDVKIKSPETNFKSSTILPSRYENNVLRYPIDIGSLDKGHYMVIHVNQQVKTQFTNNLDEQSTPTILQNQKRFNSRQALSGVGINLVEAGTDITNVAKAGLKVGQEFASPAVDKVTSAIPQVNDKVSDLVNSAFGTGVSGGINQLVKTGSEYLDQFTSGQGLRTIKRTTDSIAFYMPDTLNFTDNQQYSSLEFGSSPLAYLAAAGAGYSKVKGKSGQERINETIENLTPFILNRALQQGFGNSGAAVFAAATGTVTNPQLELIYTSPSFRQFRFDFMMYPRSSKEALEVQRILNRLRFHQAPEILKEGAGGFGSFFLVPPSEFDIEFYYNGRINPNIPKISTCVLTSIDTDYAPNGWAAYEVPSDRGNSVLGKTGMPVGIRLSLNFQETEILTKDNFDRAIIQKDDSGSTEERIR
jgi:hypothetical protein